MCGVNPAGRPTSRKLVYVPPWVYVGLAANVLVLALFYFVGRRRVTLEVTLCPDCLVADRRALTVRNAALTGLLFGPIFGALLGEPFGAAGILLGAGIGTATGAVATLAAHLHTRWSLLTCKKIDRDTVTLEGSGHLPEVLEAERPDLLADSDVSPPR